MDTFPQYILNIIAVSLLCHIALQITESCSVKKSIKPLVGILMLLSIFSPLRDFQLGDIKWNGNFMEVGERISTYGVELGKNAKSDLIIGECESYILRKADSFGFDVVVDVTIDENQIPVSVNVQGNLSPYAQRELSNIIESDLGISKENQMWTG